jgi:hypothetical protein
MDGARERIVSTRSIRTGVESEPDSLLYIIDNPSVLSVDESAISGVSVFSSCAILSGSRLLSVAYTGTVRCRHKKIVITTTMQAKQKVSLQ